MNTTTITPLRPPRLASGYKWELLVLLWVAYFLNQGDRQIFNSILPLIRDGLRLTDFQMGLVGTVFTWVYGLLVPLAGFAGDRLPRKWIIVISLMVFSLGTLASGMSTGVISLLLFRSLTTGGGEAFFYPAATSLLAQFHEKTRAMALGLLQTSLYVGITVSGWAAGEIGQRYGWRKAFWIFGVVGLAWSLVVEWRVRNTPQPAARAESILLGEVLAVIARRPTVWMLTLAFGAMVYVNVGYLTWSPTYLHENFGLSLPSAGFNSMVYHNLFAFIGVLLGSAVTDRLAARRPAVRMQANFLGLLLGAPFIYWIGHTSSLGSCYAAMALFGLFRGIYDSNLFASLYDVVEPRLRASATGLMLSFAFVIGATASTILGWMKTRAGLAAGLSSLAAFYLAGAGFILLALVFFRRRDSLS